MKRAITTLILGLSLVTIAPHADAWPGGKKDGGKQGDNGRYDRGEHGQGTDAGRHGGTWDKHTNPRPGRDSTKNRQKEGWQDRSGKRKG